MFNRIYDPVEYKMPPIVPWLWRGIGVLMMIGAIALYLHR